jgi:integrase
MNDVHTDFAQVLRSVNVRRIRFHDLRHTAASLMLDHGVPALVVSKMMGDANPSVTPNIYAHSTLDMQTWAADVMDEIVTLLVISIPQPQPIAANHCCD